MISIGVSLVVALVVSLLGTPLLIRVLRRNEYGQFIRQDGPTSHMTKRGTPTMGGVVIILSTLTAWLCAHLVSWRPPSYSGLLLMVLFVGLGLVGFLDDYIKISRQRSLGLTPLAKILGQFLVAGTFAVLALLFPNKNGFTPAWPGISVVRNVPWLNFALLGTGVAFVLFFLWVNFLVASWSNGVNLTDGLDGLATGACMLAFGAYTGISLWGYYQQCPKPMIDEAAAAACYPLRDPHDLAIISIAIVGACLGFLWWNTNPAQIFMGDTGALALGGAFAGISILTHTEFLAVVIGGLFLIEVLSDVIQIGYFKLTRRRVFRMAPIHHHFELKGWQENTIVVRFWIIAAICAIVGVSLFYAEWIFTYKGVI